MRDRQIRTLVIAALMIGLTAVATMLITIPIPGIKGYVNLGDTIIFVTAAFFGPGIALLAGGLGSSLADLLLGYVHWAPFTLVIKGLEGLVAGLFAYRMFSPGRVRWIRGITGLCLGALVMMIGYFLVAGGIMYGWPAALVALPFDFMQGAVSALLAVLLGLALRNVIRFPRPE